MEDFPYSTPHFLHSKNNMQDLRVSKHGIFIKRPRFFEHDDDHDDLKQDYRRNLMFIPFNQITKMYVDHEYEYPDDNGHTAIGSRLVIGHGEKESQSLIYDNFFTPEFLLIEASRAIEMSCPFQDGEDLLKHELSAEQQEYLDYIKVREESLRHERDPMEDVEFTLKDLQKMNKPKRSRVST